QTAYKLHSCLEFRRVLFRSSFTPDTPPPISPLNGSYIFSNASSSKPDQTTGMITTTFQITTASVPNGTYDFSNEPQLGVSYLGRSEERRVGTGESAPGTAVQ